MHAQQAKGIPIRRLNHALQSYVVNPVAMSVIAVVMMPVDVGHNMAMRLEHPQYLIIVPKIKRKRRGRHRVMVADDYLFASLSGSSERPIQPA